MFNTLENAITQVNMAPFFAVNANRLPEYQVPLPLVWPGQRGYEDRIVNHIVRTIGDPDIVSHIRLTPTNTTPSLKSGFTPDLHRYNTTNHKYVPPYFLLMKHANQPILEIVEFGHNYQSQVIAHHFYTANKFLKDYTKVMTHLSPLGLNCLFYFIQILTDPIGMDPAGINLPPAEYQVPYYLNRRNVVDPVTGLSHGIQRLMDIENSLHQLWAGLYYNYKRVTITYHFGINQFDTHFLIGGPFKLNDAGVIVSNARIMRSPNRFTPDEYIEQLERV